MKLGDEIDYIEIDVLEESKMPQNFGDIRVSVKVCMSGFFGEYDQVWIEAHGKNRFISALVNLEKTRNGSANIESMSPNEFILNISSIDSLGHMQADILLSKYSRTTNSGSNVISLTGDFEFDPGLLPGFTEEFSVYTN